MSSSSSRAVSIRIGTLERRAQAPADLEAVQLREHHVENDQVDALLREAVERLLAVVRRHDAEAVARERERQQLLKRLLVVDEKDGRGVGHCLYGLRPRTAAVPTIARRMQAPVLGSPRRQRRAGSSTCRSTGASTGSRSQRRSSSSLAVSFTVTRPQALPAPPPPAFDGRSAAALASQLATQYPTARPARAGPAAPPTGSPASSPPTAMRCDATPSRRPSLAVAACRS